MKRRIFSLLLALCMVLMLLPCPALAAEDTAEVIPPAQTAEAEANSGMERLLTDGKLEGALTRQPLYAATDNGYYTDLAEVITQLRTKMVSRERIIKLPVRVSKTDVPGEAEMEALIVSVFALATAHTGVPTEGDYLLWAVKDLQYSATYRDSGKYYYLDIAYQLDFYTSRSQEQEVTARIDSIIASFNFTKNTDDYGKALAIYDYICNRVKYAEDKTPGTSDADYKFTAYGALCWQGAVCQGYATLLYRMLLTVGIDCRVIVGTDAETGIGHAWNIAAMDGVYYNLDSTWDAGYTEYWYFLKGAANFTDHVSAYDSADFHTLYPVAEEDYVPAAPTVIASGSCGEAVEYTIYSDGYMEITGTGAMANWSSADEVPWKNFYGYIRLVSVADGITSVGSYAFANCAFMILIDLPDSIAEIGDQAFYWARMRAFVVPTGLRKVGAYAFYTVGPKDALIIQDLAAWMALDLENEYANPGYGAETWYLGGEELTDLVIPEGTTAIKDYAFRAADITSVHIPDSVTSIGSQAFYSTTALTKVTGCNKVSEIGDHAFYDSGLTEISLNGITQLGKEAFGSCEQLKKLTLGPGLTTVGEGAFYGTASLVDLYISDMAAWCNINFKFTPGYGMKRIWSNPLWRIENFYCNGELVTNLVIPDSVTKINDYAFAGYCGLVSVTIPESVTIIGTDAFFSCYRLDYVYFRGNAPEGWGDCFSKVTATGYYPAGNDTWTQDVLQNYGGNITWKASCSGPHTEETIPAVAPTCAQTGLAEGVKCSVCGEILSPQQTVPVIPHTEETIPAVAPTCTQTGLTEGVKCSVCGEILSPQQTVPELPHTFADEVCTVCGAKDPGDVKPVTGVTRIFGSNRYETAFKTAEALKEQLGVDKFNAIIVASGGNFADALGGSSLAAKKNAPILLVNEDTVSQVKDYIKANLVEGGTVYLLGGTGSVPAAMETGLSNFTVKRLAGANRYDTNLAILEELNVKEEDILICTGTSFADSLSASAVGLPLLLVDKTLTAEQKAFLDGVKGNDFYILGGTGSVSTAVEKAVTSYGDVERIGGPNRYETSVMIAKEFFPDASGAVLAYAQNFPDGLSGGALAYAMKAPLILTATKSESVAASYTKSLAICSGIILGGPTFISDGAVRTIFSMKSSDKIVVG